MWMAILLVACTETAVPTATLMPLATLPTATQIAGAAETSAARRTAVAQARETTPIPLQVTPTILPSATPSPTITPTPTGPSLPTPVIWSGPEAFDGDRNPLTGEIVPDPVVLQRRPLAVKVSNNPPKYTRPQNGLSQADLVFEHVTEAAITRFTAIFYSQTPPDIGPIRSARLIDIELPAMYDAALIFSGAHPLISQRLFATEFGDRILRSHELGYYRTGEDKPWEHTLHGDPSGFWQTLDNWDQNQPPTFTSFMSFSDRPLVAGELARHIHIEYKDATFVDWTYAAENGRYWRAADGEPSLDANTNLQINAANVVVISAQHVRDVSICIYVRDGACIDWPTQIQIWGQGAAIICRDGQQFHAIWKRENRSDMFTFVDETGNPVPLQPGNTWFQIVPLDDQYPVTIDD
jgi:hypothetical protein